MTRFLMLIAVVAGLTLLVFVLVAGEVVLVLGYLPSPEIFYGVRLAALIAILVGVGALAGLGLVITVTTLR